LLYRFRDFSVRTKMTLVVLASCAISLAVASVGLFLFQRYMMQEAFKNDIITLGQVLAHQSSGPVIFQDAQAASELLAALRSEPQVVSAVIRMPDGKALAGWGSPLPLMADARGEAQDGVRWVGRRQLHIVHGIRWRGERVGTFGLVADFTTVYGRLILWSWGLAGLVTIGAVTIGVSVTRALQGTITRPILQLAGIARSMADSAQFTQRAVRQSGDEVGMLTDAFNHMLDRQEQAAANLRRSNHELAREVSARGRAQEALVASEQRFRSMFENATVGIYRSTPDGLILMANPALVRMLGFESAEELLSQELGVGGVQESVDRRRFLLRVEREGEVHGAEWKWRKRDTTPIVVRENAKAIRDDDDRLLYFEGVVEDITARKAIEAELERLNREVQEASRQAGRAEVATGVLHNVGNVLNSVNVSVNLLQDRLEKSKVSSLEKATALIEEHRADLSRYLNDDPKGQIVPGLLVKLGRHLAEERRDSLEELKSLAANVEHVKEIVAMQQSYARVSGVLEALSPSQLMEDALRINQAGLSRHGVLVQRHYDDSPRVLVDKHKVLQILINLIRNSKYALDAMPDGQKQLDLEIRANGSGMVRMVVRDNGVGIPPNNLTRIFSHGFTTKKDGHGFGLHSGALAAKEMGGSLSAMSDGPGRGATFVLELPMAESQPPAPTP